jgi:hypothetical protein
VPTRASPFSALCFISKAKPFETCLDTSVIVAESDWVKNAIALLDRLPDLDALALSQPQLVALS